MIRRDAGLSVARFCELAGIPESSWHRRRARVRRGAEAAKGPWPAPKRRELEAVVHWLALRYPAWGYRKIWALAVARGYQVSMSTVYRIMFERGLVHEVRYQAERRELAKARPGPHCHPAARAGTCHPKGGPPGRARSA
jgi:putative transposase